VVTIRTVNDADTWLEVKVTFGAARCSAVLQRLVQIAKALEPDQGQRVPIDDCRALVTKVETDFAGACVLVTACVPATKTVEQLQRELLDLVPPA
jgi:hypothetical protein